MIQRIQSVFLFLAAGLGIAALFLPVAHFYQGFTFPADVQFMMDNWKFSTFGGILKVSALISLIAIFLFKKRKRQIIWVRIAQFLCFAAICFGVYCFYPFKALPETNQIWPMIQAYITKYWAIFFPFLVLIFNALAIRFIKKDDKLVRSMDRLR